MLLNPSDKQIASIIKRGGIGVIPTDTIYGLVGSALLPKTVQRIYSVKRRETKNPFIILVSHIAALAQFGIELDPSTKRVLDKVWPGKVSVVLPCGKKQFTYLHQSLGSLAFRLPAHPWLQALLKRTGPLVAPSANLSGRTPAKNTFQAQEQFQDSVDFYVDQGEIAASASTLISLERGKMTILRQGEHKIN